MLQFKNGSKLPLLHLPKRPPLSTFALFSELVCLRPSRSSRYTTVMLVHSTRNYSFSTGPMHTTNTQGSSHTSFLNMLLPYCIVISPKHSATMKYTHCMKYYFQYQIIGLDWNLMKFNVQNFQNFLAQRYQSCFLHLSRKKQAWGKTACTSTDWKICSLFKSYRTVRTDMHHHHSIHRDSLILNTG